ncbi:MAG: hypothetical protein PVJ83_07445 [Gammaproteobacteria bacterium]
MWQFHTSRLTPYVVRATLSAGGHAIGFGDVIAAWRSDASFLTFWAGALCSVPFDAYCLELPPLLPDGCGRPFECVFVESTALARAAPDPAPFAEHFRAHPDCSVVAFENLGKDALLVAPCPRAGPDVYTHLAAFLRGAAPAQIEALWQRAAAALNERMGEAPVWFSTAGLGVFWLHLRLDSRPKYYRYRPYANRHFGT